MRSIEKRKEERLKQITRKTQPVRKSETHISVIQKNAELALLNSHDKLKVNFEEIKRHEKLYMEKVKER